MPDYRSALVLLPTAAEDDRHGASPFDNWLHDAGWDPDRRVLRPTSAHETLGWQECGVTGCDRPAWGIKNRGLCNGCDAVWRNRGEPDIAIFTQQPSRRIDPQLHELCSIERDGVRCQRRASSHGLCKPHSDQLRHHLGRGRNRATIIASLTPHPRAPECRVVACDRQSDFMQFDLCVSHHARWVRATQQGAASSLEEFCRTTSQITDSRLVVFAGLDLRVARQILYGVYTRSRRGSMTRTQHLQQVVDYVRAMQVSDLRDVADMPRPDIWPNSTVKPLLNTVLKAVQYGDLTPEDFQHADLWPGAVFGMNSQIDFRNITQSWLRQLTQAWCWDNLHRFGDFSAFIKLVNEINYFSAYLHDNTPASGNDIAGLDRATISGFAAFLAELVRTGAPRARNKLHRGGQNLTFTWNRGLQTGCLLAVQRILRYGSETDRMDQFAGSFMITDDLLPRRVPAREPEAGRALPVGIMRQLFAPENLNQLQTRAAQDPRLLRILAETGRRPSEITSLRYHCLDHGPGGPFLLYTENKVTGGQLRKLPVLAVVVETINQQQDHVRTRFPNTEPSQLALFPRLTMNSHGHHPTHPSRFGHTFSNWIRSLDRLDSAEVGHDGEPTPYDRSQISAYAFRHTYAQRHADAGTPPDVLKELMGHETIATTMGYYRITQKRRREATELVGNLVAGDGALTIAKMSKSQRLANEHASIAVPFGKCSNPQNVAAEGHGCPIRHRCFGCASFSSDPSYLPEMRRRLLDLKAVRARIDAFDGAQEWAKRDARPSDEEIAALEQRIRTEEDTLATATPEQRSLIDEATSTLRKARAAATVDLTLGQRPDLDNTWTTYTDARRHSIDILGKITK